MLDILYHPDYLLTINVGLVFIAIFLSKMAYSYRKKVHAQNIQLIKLYLDRKFINKLISIFSDAGCEDKDRLLISLTKKIKEYYQIDDILIYSPDSEQHFLSMPGVYYRSVIIEHINNIQKSLFDDFRKKRIVTNLLQKASFQAVLYIAPVSYGENNLIVFVQRSGSTLENQEIETLVSCVIGILGIALKM